MREQCLALLAAAGPACVAVKFQLARFEVLGAPGRELLGELAVAAREQGLLVIADGKRGDIDVTAAAYAAALFDGLRTPLGELTGLGADLATVNPLMGLDAVEPFLAAARARGSRDPAAGAHLQPGRPGRPGPAAAPTGGRCGRGWPSIVDRARGWAGAATAGSATSAR